MEPTMAPNDHQARLSPGLQPDPAARRKCFIVEDEPGIRNLFYAALGKLSIDFGGFGSLQELRKAWRPEHPDMIFLDAALEGSDAIDVIRELAARKYHGAVQLVSGLDHALLDQIKRVGE